MSFVVAFIIYIPMAFYKKVIPSDTTSGEYLPVVNDDVTSTVWFRVYEILLEICVRYDIVISF